MSFKNHSEKHFNQNSFLGLVSRESEKFSVKSNIEPGDKVVFKLTYDQLLERSKGQYEYALDINPGQIVEVCACF